MPMDVLHPFTFLKRILGMYSPFARFDAVASNSEGDELESKALGMAVEAIVHRSHMTIAAVLAILAYFTQTSKPNEASIMINTFVTLLVLCLCLLNRACFDGLPVDVFRNRVKSFTVIGATMLYTIPELYIFLFIVVEGYNLVGLAAVLSVLAVTVLHILLVILLNVN
ncbi:hypothetical protein DL96DRAFT_1678131 [Flagelloscypha sp. PMI_526]|nr:hypothetical protein DL96DRAFT_1678131 [Flagelloscypha sp. PMI_526]